VSEFLRDADSEHGGIGDGGVGSAGDFVECVERGLGAEWCVGPVGVDDVVPAFAVRDLGDCLGHERIAGSDGQAQRGERGFLGIEVLGAFAGVPHDHDFRGCGFADEEAFLQFVPAFVAGVDHLGFESVDRLAGL
jgi:hypothetical protein